MANALAMMMSPTGLPGVDPTRQPPMPGMSTSTAVAPAPMQKPQPNALANPMTANFNPPKPKQQNMLLSSAVNGFQRGLDPKGWQAGQDQAKADKAEGVKKQIAMLQNIRALPMEQRMQALPQISQSIGKQIPPELMQDQAIDTHLAMLMGEAGIAPEQAEYMNLGGGAVGKTQNGQFTMAREAAVEPPKPTIVNNRVIDPNDPTKVLADYSDPAKPPPAPDGFTLGKGQVRYDANGKEIARGPAGSDGDGEGGGAMDPERIRLEREYAKSWDGVRNNFGEVDGQYKRLVALGNLAKTDEESRSAADLGLIVSFTKMLDPGSVAREGEVKLTQSAASLFDMVKNLPNQWKNGQTTLPDETRDALLKAAAEMHPIYQRAYDKLGQSYLNTAKSYQYDPSRVMMGTDLGDFDNMSDEEVQSIFDGIEQAAASPTGSGAVPTEAAAELMRDPSPEALAEFDDAFGPGMAQRVLNGSR